MERKIYTEVYRTPGCQTWTFRVTPGQGCREKWWIESPMTYGSEREAERAMRAAVRELGLVLNEKTKGERE